VSLVDAATGHDWVTDSVGLGALSYRTYTENDFTIWNEEYNPGCGPPCGDFAKYGMDTASPRSAVWTASSFQLYQGGGRNNCTFVAALSLDPEATSKYGGAEGYYVNFTLDQNQELPSPTLLVELTWVNKTATRLAESTWLSFNPALESNPDPSKYSVRSSPN
jgi:hypothetical protein